MRARLAEDDHVAGVDGHAGDPRSSLLERDVALRDRKVRLVAAGHHGEAAVVRSRIGESVGHHGEPVHDLAVAVVVILRRVPRRVAAVQAELLAAGAHQQRVAVVVAELRADERLEIRQHARVREQTPERLVPSV